MEIHVEQFITSADSKALATSGASGLNVVPVSSLKVVEGKIWLINYFMDKTLQNILENKNVSLVCWTKMMGYQIKGAVEYKTTGAEFDQAVTWIREMLPDRIVKGLLIISPTDIYDIAPTKNTKEKFEALPV
ncbi:MAG: pyridoxamine 5'-phosphate oxidase family protein [Candidatus Pacebacteria bacterium]|nr:pyridoxamine 5'-phosphate oxidase family protein [Candidatus Paceibacterota bacterium]MBP9851495.1 pyridoxamine 5'-phosphate oxidase family protein [Candidatus Paceibacterota bacterium]